MQSVVWLTGLCVTLLGPLSAQRTWYVRPEAPPGGGGTTWANAFVQLPEALRIAKAGDVVCLAAGVYRPDPTEATAAFRLPAGVTLRGGFRGEGQDFVPQPQRYVSRLVGHRAGAPNGPAPKGLCVLRIEGNAMLPTTVAGITLAYDPDALPNTQPSTGVWLPPESGTAALTLRDCWFENLGGTGSAVAIEGSVRVVRWANCRWSRNQLTNSLLRVSSASVERISVDSCRLVHNDVTHLLEVAGGTSPLLDLLSLERTFVGNNVCSRSAFRTDGNRVLWQQDTVWENAVQGPLIEAQNNQPGPNTQRVSTCWFRDNTYTTWFTEAPPKFSLGDDAHLRCVQSAFTRNRGFLYRGPLNKVNKARCTAAWDFCTFAENAKVNLARADSANYWFDVRRLDSVSFNSCVLADTLGDGSLCVTDNAWVQVQHSLLGTFGQAEFLNATVARLAWANNNLARTPPHFADSDRADFRLHPCSPALDAGDAERAQREGLRNDLQGLARVANRGPDVGAWETARFVRRDSVRQLSCSLQSGGGEVVYGGQYCPPLRYQWTMGNQQGNSPTDLAPGTYFFTVTDARGTTLRDTVRIVAESRFQVQSEVILPSAPTFTNGFIRLHSPAGGTPPYRVLWSTGSTLPELSNLAAGVYHATVTDGRGCRVFLTFDLRLTDTQAGVPIVFARLLSNPVSAGHPLTLLGIAEPTTITLHDVSGRLYARSATHASEATLIAPSVPGMYWLQLTSRLHRQTIALLVL